MSSTFGINELYRRQTPQSKYSYFTGEEEDLLNAIEQNFPLRKPGRRDGSWVVPLPNKVGKGIFYTAVVPINRSMFLNAEVVARQHETPLVCASGVCQKARAAYAHVVLYSKELLESLGEKPTTASDFEVVSLHGSDVDNQPEHPYDIAREVLNNGAKYDSQTICEAIIYWAQHVYVKPQFTKHVDQEIAKLLSDGDMDGALKIRKKKYPDETDEDNQYYLEAVQNFLHLTGQYYR